MVRHENPTLSVCTPLCVCMCVCDDDLRVSAGRMSQHWVMLHRISEMNSVRRLYHFKGSLRFGSESTSE